jgi:hypothetical protein
LALRGKGEAIVSAKTTILAALAVAALLSGVVSQYLYPGRPLPPSSFMFSIVGIILVFLWFRLDANARGYTRSPFLNVGVVAFAIIALPYYFFRSRGALRGSAATVVMLLAAVGWSVLGYVGAFAVYHGLQS